MAIQPMTTTDFARLSDTELRNIWPDEARDFTPWLFENIHRLSEALGLELEATGMEVAVEQYSADIVATEARSGFLVLIENQLNPSDHSHLGQIMTYLAGLDVNSVIWIAKEFHEAHRSAVRWINENTSGDFAFFAVRLRVVQIDESRPAPIFEVVEQPDEWKRTFDKTTKKGDSEHSRLCGEFWSRYLEIYPDTFKHTRHRSVWFGMPPDKSIILSVNIGYEKSRIFLRGQSGTGGKDISGFMEKNKEKLDEYLVSSESIVGGYYHDTEGYYYGVEKDIRLRDKEQWDEVIRWMEDKRRLYRETLESVLERDDS